MEDGSSKDYSFLSGPEGLSRLITGKAPLLLVFLIFSSAVSFGTQAPLPAPETDSEALQLTEEGFLVVSDPSRSVKVPGQVRFYDGSGNRLENQTLYAEWLGQTGGEVEDVRKYRNRWMLSASRGVHADHATIITDNISQHKRQYLFGGSGHIVKSGNRTYLVASDSGYSRDRVFYVKTDRPVKRIPEDVDVYSKEVNLTSENIYKEDIDIEGVDRKNNLWVAATSEEENLFLNFYNASWDKTRTLELKVPKWNSSYEVSDLVINGTEYWILADSGQFGGEIFVTDERGELLRNYTVGIRPNKSQIIHDNVREYEPNSREKSGGGGKFLIPALILIIISLLSVVAKDL